ncbi:TPA: tetratricopeptide repeat protein [Aeromonas salmonicida subsp. pectinolytica]
MAYHHYHKAATTGHFDAQYELGLLYFSGLVITKNMTKAAIWYSRSAMQRYSEAQLALVALGKTYLSGSGVPQNDKLSCYWLSTRLNKRESDAPLHL